MQGISAEENGISYIFLCLLKYSGSCLFLLWYALCVLYLCVRGSLEERRYFALPGICLALTVFNPVFPLVLNRFFDVNSEYYRFIWIAPVVPLISYICVRFVTLEKYRDGRNIPLLLSAALFLMASGVFVHGTGSSNSRPFAENSFKVPNEVIEVSKLIHRASDSDFPRAICDLNMEMEIRQYDASILLAADREQFLGAIYGTAFDDQTREKNHFSDILVEIMVHNTKYPKDVFLESMENTHTEFFVVMKNSPINGYLKDMGLKNVGETYTRNVLMYEPETGKPFRLPDYKDVWIEQKFPWSILN